MFLHSFLSSCGGLRFFRIDSPRISMRWALWRLTTDDGNGRLQFVSSTNATGGVPLAKRVASGTAQLAYLQCCLQGSIFSLHICAKRSRITSWKRAPAVPGEHGVWK